MKKRVLGVVATLALASGGTGWAATESVQSNPVLEALQTEVKRSMESLADEATPPYFLAYEVTQTHMVRITGAFGAIEESSENLTRQLDIDLRVGDYSLDNTHQVGDRFARYFDHSDIALPVTDDVEALRSVIWYHTDARYRRAVERFTRVQTDVQVKVEREDRSADFSRQEPSEYFGALHELDVNRAGWEKRIRRLTAPFAASPTIYAGRASLTAEVETRWFVSSEGSVVQVSQPRYRLMVRAQTKAEDGMELPRFESYYATSESGLPDEKVLLADVGKMVADLEALREAPIVDPYAGPAILSGRASGVFFHEVFGHRIEGHRQKDEFEGQTFKKKIGEKLLPENFDVVFDPTRKLAGGKALAGTYLYDNQGVKARPVTVVDDGVFKSFLMSRSPVEGFAESNGHGRRQPGFAVVARQSNLLVDVEDPLTRDQLKDRLLQEVKKQGKPYGLLFEDIMGGFTLTGRTIPNAFNVLPIMVYRVYPDGNEELVRGVDLIGTPLTAFSRITAADDAIEVFNGTCGAESGGVPVAAASPGILVSQIEVQKKEKSQSRPPLLPAPDASSEGEIADTAPRG